MRYIDADHFLKSLNSVVEKNGSEVWRKIADTMTYMVEAEATLCGKDIVTCGECIHYHQKAGACMKQDYGYGYKESDFCSKGERK